MSEMAPENSGASQAPEAPRDEQCAAAPAAQEERVRVMEMFSGLFDDPRDADWEERQMAAWSVVHKSEPSFRPCMLPVNGDNWLVELGPRMTRVYNMYFDPDDALDVCGDYGFLMDVEYVCEKGTLVVRVRCKPEPLPFPQGIALGEVDPEWERKCEVYGRLDFDGGVYLPIRGFRVKPTSPEDISLICENRLNAHFGRGSEVGVEVSQAVEGGGSPSVVVSAPQQPPQAEPASREMGYPLPVGKLIVKNADWTFVSFGSVTDFPLGGQAQKILKAMYLLGALSAETAVSCEAIMDRAGIESNITVAKPFSAGDKGNSKNAYRKLLYDTCVSNAEPRPGYPGRYYLTQPG